MTTLSRRQFLGQASAASACTLGGSSWASSSGNSLFQLFPAAAFPVDFPDHWKTFGRIALQRLGDSVLLEDGFAVSNESWTDADFSFRARAPQGTNQVQIWAGMRCRDRDSRYVFALRGGDNDDVYLARYGADGGAKFLGVAPLDFHPEPGSWYALRMVVRGDRMQVYVNDETVPRINVRDEDAPWSEGGLVLGGGWLPVEFRDIHVRPLSAANAATFDAMGATVWELPSIDQAPRRREQRAAYRAVKIAAFPLPRTEVSLDGNWLFLPEQDLKANAPPQVPDSDDLEWHVMDVPNFWTPTLTWLHGETGFPYLSGVSATKGVCDKVYEEEIRRLDNYTFEWRECRGAWYRQHLDLPLDLSGRRFEICFDAIAKLSEVWVNGTQIGSHVGMFGEVRCDATAAMRPGHNVIAVHVRGSQGKAQLSNQVMDVAVTVEVTQSMLHSLPHGMFRDDAAGIWQPVKLIVTRQVTIEDIFIEPRLDGLDCSLTIRSASADIERVEVAYSIRSAKDNEMLYTSPHGQFEEVKTNGSFHFSTPTLAPRPWSPQSPNLYRLEVTITSGNQLFDRRVVTFGFRTFAVRGGRLLLNGKPFWLRGGNHFPHSLRPNDKKLARRFIELAKEGNVIATRSHTAPFTETWLEASDEIGMAVSFEGTWPWLMLKGEPPSDDLLRVWKEEFISLLRKYRNHPSIVFWTVNNEMKFEFFDQKQPELLKRKWTILTDTMKTMRLTDPTRPIVCDSSYYRQGVATEYADLIRPSGFDDGDIDDAHRYYGWYNASFFHFFHGEFGKTLSWPGRPLISQEMSTGYPRNDDGHPTRSYLFSHYTPQSLVGDEAYENRDPAIFLKRQAFMTKGLAEAFRRSPREDCSGILHFAYLCWFKNVWSVDSIQPFETYYSLKKALQPVLVSAELYGRHFYAGSSPSIRVCIANDSGDCTALPVTRFSWEMRGSGKVVAHGTAPVPAVPYYSNAWIQISMPLPATLPSPRINGSLIVRLENDGILLSENDYDVTLATRAWAEEGMIAEDRIVLFDPHESAPELLRKPGIRTIASLNSLRPDEVLVIAAAEDALLQSGNGERLQHFVQNGGRALLLNAGTRLPALFPSQVTGFRLCEGEIAGMHIPESKVFDRIESLDLSWFELGGGKVPRACRGVYRIERGRRDVVALAEVVDIHGYLKKPENVVDVSGSPLVEIHVGRGTILASEMMLEAASDDPIAGRLLCNLLQVLRS